MLPILSMCSRTARGWWGRLQRLRQDDIVERIVGIIDEVGIGVALDDRKAPGYAFVDALLADLDTAPVDVERRLQEFQ